MLLRLSIGICIALGLLGGCNPVPTGRDFPNAGFAQIKLGIDNEARVQAVLGVPFGRVAMQGTVTNPKSSLPYGSSLSITLLTYSYTLSGTAQVAGLPLQKIGHVGLLNDRVQAYDLTSTIPGEENPPFDETRLTGFTKGVTTRAQIVAAMGPPSSQTLYQRYSIPPKPGVVNFIWVQSVGAVLRQKRAHLELDADDVLTDFTMLDTTGPAPPPTPDAYTPPPSVIPYMPPYRAPTPPKYPTLTLPKPPALPHT